MFSQTRFSQMLQLIPRQVFKKAVSDTGADRYSKRFNSWDVLVTMIYGQVHQIKSLRTLVSAFGSLGNHHYHLNAKSMSRSTLSDALSKRNPEPFRIICETLLKGVARQQRKSVQEMICLIDSTLITLKGSGFDGWAQATRTRITQGLKIHVGMDPHQVAPTYANISHANVNDLTDAQLMPIEKGMTYVFDKGYCDYNWWSQIDRVGSYFVTRLKKNANVTVIEEREVVQHAENRIECDTIVQFTKKHLHGKRINEYLQRSVRRIVVKREAHDTPLILITNDLSRSADEIAALYKQRWQIELLFKWLKQKLNLKRYFGFSENAVRLQIYAALITYLLMLNYRIRAKYEGAMSTLAITLSHNLLERPDLMALQQQRERNKDALLRQKQNQLVFV